MIGGGGGGGGEDMLKALMNGRSEALSHWEIGMRKRDGDFDGRARSAGARQSTLSNSSLNTEKMCQVFIDLSM